MKRNVMASVLSLLMLLSLCCGCQGKNGEGGESTNAPDSSRLLYFDEIFSLSQHHPVVWTDVVVQKVYPDVYTDKYAGEAYLLASCKVQKTFFASPDCPNQTVLSQEGSDCRITEEELTSPPNLYIKNLSGWGLIPIIDGVVDGSVVQRMVEDGRDGEIAYRMDLTDMDWDPPRIVNGDTKEELYQFLEEYVKEHTK